MPHVPTLRRRLARLRRRLAGAPPPSSPITLRQDYFYLGPDLALKQLNNGRFIYVDPQDEHISAMLIGSRTSAPDLIGWLSSLGFRFWVIEKGGRLVERAASAMADAPPPCDVVLSRAEPRLAT